MQLTSLSLALTRAGFLSFSPASLFAAGEPGVWYDPSDMSTMFQDAAGTTPVTAVEQPVGLILDKSKGLVLGPELVTNGDFSNGTTGWSGTSGGSIANVGGKGVVTTVNGDSAGGALNSVTVTVGKWYKVSWNVEAFSQTGWAVQLGTSALLNAYYDSGVLSSLGSFTNYVLATDTTLNIRIYARSNGIGDQTATFDNISVRELPGNHATQTTATSRPVLSARYNLLTKTEQFDDAVWSKTNLRAFGSGSIANASLAPDGTTTADLIVESTASADHSINSPSFSVTAGVPYTISISAKANTRNHLNLRVNDNATNANAAAVLVSLSDGSITEAATAYGTFTGVSATVSAQANGFYRVALSFTPSVAVVNPKFEISNGAARTADGRAVYAGDGTSGIYIWGASLVPANQSSLPYQRVNTATDYDADPAKFPVYLRFDGVDDWLQTNSVNFTGTDKMTVFAGVRKLSDANESILYELSSNTASNNGALNLFAPGGISVARDSAYVAVSKGTVASVCGPSAASYPAPITNVVTAASNISGDSVILRVNGTQAASSATDQGTGNYGNYPLYIGRRGGASIPFNGLIYGLVIRGAASTTSQIQQTEAWLNQRTGAF